MSRILLTFSGRAIRLSEKSFQVNLNTFSPAVFEAAAKNGVSDFIVNSNKLLWYPPDKKIEISLLPEDVCIRKLDVTKDVPVINGNWPHRFPGSDKFLTAEISNNFGLGVYSKRDKKLLSWCVCNHGGIITFLATDPHYRGKGYADAIVRQMAIQIKNQQKIPFACILVTNTTSLNIFTKIGFEIFTKNCYILPKNKFMETKST